MGAWRKILRAILDDDGAPGIFSGLVAGSQVSDHSQGGASQAAESQKQKTAQETRTTKRPQS